jgi:hypothetical protein
MTQTDRINGVLTSLAIKAPVKAATTANITRSGEQTIDGVALVTGNRVLVKNQTDAEENGIYVVDTSSWERAADFDSARDAVYGTLVYVAGGTTNGDKWYRVSTADPFVIGTDDLSFTEATFYDTSGFLRAVDGDVTTPGISFADDTDTGFYRVASGRIGVALNGVSKWQFWGNDLVAFNSTGAQIRNDTGGGNTGALIMYGGDTATTNDGAGIIAYGLSHVTGGGWMNISPSTGGGGTARVTLDGVFQTRLQTIINARYALTAGSYDQFDVVAAKADLHVYGSSGSLGASPAITGLTVSTNADGILLEQAGGNGGMTIATESSYKGAIYFADESANAQGQLAYDHATDSFQLAMGGSERYRFLSTIALFGKTSSNVGTAGSEINTSGLGQFTRDSNTCLIVNRLTNDGTLVSLRQDGTEEGAISVSTTTVTYGTFCGSHWSQLLDMSKPEILEGTILESIDGLCEWWTPPENEDQESELEHNIHLPKFKVSDEDESASVYGVFFGWDNAEDESNRDALVASLGAFVIRVNGAFAVRKGDLLVSNGDGTARPQDDDVFKAKTIAKVTSNSKTRVYDDGSYLVPCTLHCG